MCVDHTHWGITTIPKNGMLGVTELSYHFWYDIHTSFFTVQSRKKGKHIAQSRRKQWIGELYRIVAAACMGWWYYPVYLSG